MIESLLFVDRPSIAAFRAQVSFGAQAPTWLHMFHYTAGRAMSAHYK